MSRFKLGAVIVLVGISSSTSGFALDLPPPKGPPRSTEELILQELRGIGSQLQRLNNEKPPLAINVDETSVACGPGEEGDPFGCQGPAQSLCERIGYSSVLITRSTGMKQTETPRVHEIVCFDKARSVETPNFKGVFKFDTDGDEPKLVPID